MDIVYTVNNNFVPQVATGICSILENNKNNCVHIYVISDGITEENKHKLIEYVHDYNQEIDIIELGSIDDYIDFSFDTGSWNSIVLARLFLDRILPESVEKVLYLDGDTMVRGDLKELWNIDMSNYVLGACVEPTAPSDRKANIGIDADKPYFNAGVLFINMVKWKSEEAGKKVIDFYKLHNGKLFANDQCAINGSLKDEIIMLPFSYNYCNTYNFYSYKSLVKMMQPCNFVDSIEYKNCISNPIIIHFLGEERPWRNGNKHKYSSEYMSYWKKTPWGNVELEQGWENYFKLFNLFNLIMRPFPMLRYTIMNKLIPIFIRCRKKA